MKIADIATYVMRYEANLAIKYPEAYSSLGTIQALKVIDQLTARLGEGALEKEHSVIKIIEILDVIYPIGSAPAIDAWIDEHDREYSKVLYS